MDNIKLFFNKIGLWFKNIFVSVDNKPSKLRKMSDKPGFTSFMASFISILIGLIFGLLLLLVLNPSSAFSGLGKILFTGLADSAKMAKVLYMSAPLIMTGLAVGFAFKTGLFNIGASGQYLMGGFFALFTAIIWHFPWWLALLFSIIGGAIWGAIPGIFKALLNVNEVITSIMFNWIGLFIVNLCILNTPKMIANYYGASTGDRTANLAVVNQNAIIPKWGLDKLFDSNYMNIGIFIAILFAILIHIILNKTTFGYELKACGFNRNASVYAGINAKRNIILSMTIAGALAGLGGGLYYLTGIGNYTIVKELQAMGFNGIPVALLGASNPIGIIFAGLFISYIQVGGEALQPTFTREVIDIIIAVIIYMSAMSLMVKLLITKLIKNKKIREEEMLDEKETAVIDTANATNDGAGILPPDSKAKEVK